MDGRQAIVAVALWLVVLAGASRGEQPADSLLEAAATITQGPPMLPLALRVVDENGQPVTGATVIPWALRSSEGHGLWANDDTRAQIGPVNVTTDAAGKAAVLYPRYRNLAEQVQTLSVSLRVDHPEFAAENDLHIDVPLETKEPYAVCLSAGARVEIRPLLDGEPTTLEDIFVLWSDARSGEKGSSPEVLPGGVLRIPPFKPGKNSLLVVKLDGERATHFSQLTDLDVAAGEVRQLDVPLQPARRVTGVMSDAVPRPVKAGRISVWTLPPGSNDFRRVFWHTWAPVQADGSFVIDGWPAGEAMQLIALCDGYMARSGSPPEGVEYRFEPGKDPFSRPQVFHPETEGQIEVEMAPLSRCVVTVVDEGEHPVVGITVMSWPNVGWWNVGSQVYCNRLIRGERVLRERDYHAVEDDAFPPPFRGTTDAEGKVTLELPPGREHLAIRSEVYELPVFLGQRNVRIELKPDSITEETLRLQPRGTEKLGEWDKLAGVVFGCSTREGRRICALPGVSKKMDEFAERFREGKNRRDPQLLAEAYTAVADAFVGVGDHDEAAKWREKAARQLAIANSSPANVGE